MDKQNATVPHDLLDKIGQTKNILVTVSNNPSIDQLAACLGLTIWLNRAGKHATAVFSGEVPSTLEFLEPAETLEKNTDSLRDFIIALDKSKADKLRYKVEENVVKIFITPYRTSLSADDLEFSQGDFNVDMVIALGVSDQADLDTAITAHGRILHDATVVTVTTGETSSELGAINWHDNSASSLSELVVDLGNGIAQKELDGQIATALLTGVVAETERFSNAKTTPQTMNVSAELMSAGANQQLVASKLDEPEPEPEPEVQPATDEPEPEAKASEDGTLEISHPAEEEPEFDATTLPEVNEAAEPETPASVEEPEQPAPEPEPPVDATPESEQQPGRLITEPPTLGGQLTANNRPEDIMNEPTTDPMSMAATDVEDSFIDKKHTVEPAATAEPTPAPEPQPEALQPAPPTWMPPQPWMDKAAPATEALNTAATPAPETPAEPETPEQPTSEPEQPVTMPTSEPPAPVPDSQPEPETSHADDGQTLADIERQVGSTHPEVAVPEQSAESLDDARDKVMAAISSEPEDEDHPEPIAALNAQPIDLGTTTDVPGSPVLPADQPPAGPAVDNSVLPALPPQPELPELKHDDHKESLAFDPAAFGLPPEHANDELSLPGVTPADGQTPEPELTTEVSQSFTLPVPPALNIPPVNPVPPTSASNDPAAPPPYPPPFMPPSQ